MSCFTTLIKTNLNGTLGQTQLLDGIMMTGDNAANKFVVHLHRDSETVRLEPDAVIKGYFMRSDGETIETDGSVDENGRAYVITPEEAYLSSGMLGVAIRLLEDPILDENDNVLDWNKKIVIGSVQCYVKQTDTDQTIIA